MAKPQPPIITRECKDNHELNQAICEAGQTGQRVAFAESGPGFHIDRSTVRKLTPTETAEARQSLGIVMESAGDDSGMYEAKVFHTDKINSNDRIYTRAVMQDNVDQLKPYLAEGYLCGAVDHLGPSDGGNLRDTCVIYRDLQINATGEGIAKFEVVKKHSRGSDLQANIEAGMKIGFSTYGYGSGHEPTEEERKQYGLGKDQYAVVMDRNYELKKIDAVDDPSVPDARIVSKKDSHKPEGADPRGVMEAKPGVHLTISEVRSKLKPLTEAKADRPNLQRTYLQYLKSGDVYSPTGDMVLAPTLEQDAYWIVPTIDGIRFRRAKPETDDLLKFPSSTMDSILKEIDTFWESASAYKEFGFMHNRGIIMEGPPGSGKTCLSHQVSELVVDRGDVVFHARSIWALTEGLNQFREVEPDRKVVVIFEDADEYIGYQERELLQLLDGDSKVNGVFYLASTNNIDRFPERLVRPRRFDKVIHVGPPPIEGRQAYLKSKLTGKETESEIDRMSKETDGLSFAHLAELVAAVYVLKQNKEEVISRLKGRTRSQSRSGSPEQRAESTSHRLVPTEAGHPAVAESLTQPIGDTFMATEIKVEKTPEQIKAELAQAGKVATDKLNAAVKPILDHFKDQGCTEFPVREVLPREVSERVATLEGSVAERDNKIATLETEKASLVKENTELKAEKANTVRLGKVKAKASVLLKDNRFAEALAEDIETASADTAFDESKVEDLIKKLAARYEKIAGPAKPKSGKDSLQTESVGVDVDEESMTAMDLAIEGGADDSEAEVKPIAALESAFGRKKVAAESR